MKDKKDKLTILAEQLLKKEVLFQSDLEELVGPRPFEQLTSYQEFIKGETEKKRKDAKDERDLAESEKIKVPRKPAAKAKSEEDVAEAKKPVRKRAPKPKE